MRMAELKKRHPLMKRDHNQCIATQEENSTWKVGSMDGPPSVHGYPVGRSLSGVEAN